MGDPGKILIRILFANLVLSIFSACQAMGTSVDNFKIRNIQPNMLEPKQSSFELSYDLLVDSKNPVPVPIPVDGFDVGIYLEDERAADSRLPPGVTTIKIGQPVTLNNKIVLANSPALAAKLPIIVNKGRWDIKINGTMNLQGYRLPVNYSTDIANPVKKGGSLIPGF